MSGPKPWVDLGQGKYWQGIGGHRKNRAMGVGSTGWRVQQGLSELAKAASQARCEQLWLFLWPWLTDVKWANTEPRKTVRAALLQAGAFSEMLVGHRSHVGVRQTVRPSTHERNPKNPKDNKTEPSAVKTSVVFAGGGPSARCTWISLRRATPSDSRTM